MPWVFLCSERDRRMYVNPDDEVDTAGCGSQLAHRHTITGHPPVLTTVDGKALHMSGTIDAKIDAHDPHFYGKQSQMLIACGTLRTAGKTELARKVPMRAKDLIDELQTINSQIHQIMFQVERAVSRLATS